MLTEDSGRSEFAIKLFPIIAPGIETQPWIQTTEIGVASDMVPMRVGNEDARQFGQAGDLRPQRLISGLGGIRPRTGIDTDQFSPVVRYHEVVFGEFETR
jgi:hypothetical protein